MPNYLIKRLVFILSFCFTGCQSVSELAPSRSETGPQIERAAPGVLKKYSAFYIPEIEVFTVEGDVLRRVSQNEVAGLAVEFRSKLIRSLADKYSTLPHSATNLAIIKIAISDVSSTYTLMQLYPGLLIPNALRGGASIEARVIDSVSGREVMIFRDSKQGERQGFFSGLGKWDGVKKAFDEWALQLNSAISK